VLNPDLGGRVEQLKADFARAKPFPHVSVLNLCTEDAARKLHEEIRQLQGTMKETDLFRVIQTGDLANADENDKVHAEKLKHLLALRRELNSERFRKMIEEITGCGALSSQVDLSANVYCRGCHLLCHDDVIGSRRVSYIVYLNDPDDEWHNEDGGRLELYPSDENGLPEAEPTVKVLPTFNSLAMFVVEPGVSYHSVEEVFTEDKPRVSLQGWFHAENPPKDYDKATLQQILNPAIKEKMTGVEVDISSHLAGVNLADFLSDEDVEDLKSWINPDYLTSQSVEMIREKCATEYNFF
jgi:Rps23 Pro-64 3,4-dihydroxylase Tpa1-like proline 4-hydroxylase